MDGPFLRFLECTLCISQLVIEALTEKSQGFGSGGVLSLNWSYLKHLHNGGEERPKAM